MNRYVKDYIIRGLIFGGFGPIIAGIVYLILAASIKDFSLTGYQVFLAIISTYILAFIQAGASVFNQIEKWPIYKSIGCHLGSIYTAYILCYLINSWIPFKWTVILIFTIIFLVTYFIIWFSIYFAVKNISKKFNSALKI